MENRGKVPLWADERNDRGFEELEGCTEGSPPETEENFIVSLSFLNISAFLGCVECCVKGWIRTANSLWHLQEMMRGCVATKGSIRTQNIMRLLQEMMNERSKTPGVTKRAKRWIGIHALGAFLQRGEVLSIASVDLSPNLLLAEYSSIHMHRTLGLINSCPRFELQTCFLDFCHTLIGPQSFPSSPTHARTVI